MTHVHTMSCILFVQVSGTRKTGYMLRKLEQVSGIGFLSIYV